MKSLITHEGHGLHYSIFHHRSPFAKAAACAMVIGVGDLLATGADLIWLGGDMLHTTHPYHIAVGIGLVSAFIAMLISFVYLYHSAFLFIKKVTHSEKVLLDSAKHKKENIKYMISVQEDEVNRYL